MGRSERQSGVRTPLLLPMHLGGRARGRQGGHAGCRFRPEGQALRRVAPRDHNRARAIIEDLARGAAEQQTGEATVAAAAEDEHRRTVLVAGLHELLPRVPFGQFLDDFHVPHSGAACRAECLGSRWRIASRTLGLGGANATLGS
jgi:hypothetical protein